MVDRTDSRILDQLNDRRTRLERVLISSPEDPRLLQLLKEVDEAIDRLDKGSYGLCKSCNELIETDRIITNPLVQYCLECLTPAQQRALEQDLELAYRIQMELLPPKDIEVEGWEAAYHYEGADPISGDYCDLLSFGGDLFFTVGDVSGKGIAASMLMAHLHATLRALVYLELPIEELIERASRTFCESTLPTHFATLVFGRADSKGDVKICNAGHHPPLLVKQSKIEVIKATGLPLGMFCDERFSFHAARLEPGDSLILYTDGLVEAVNESDVEYGIDRLSKVVGGNSNLSPELLISTCLEDLKLFQSGVSKYDDLTIMVVRKL